MKRKRFIMTLMMPTLLICLGERAFGQSIKVPAQVDVKDMAPYQRYIRENGPGIFADAYPGLQYTSSKLANIYKEGKLRKVLFILSGEAGTGERASVQYFVLFDGAYPREHWLGSKNLSKTGGLLDVAAAVLLQTLSNSNGPIQQAWVVSDNCHDKHGVILKLSGNIYKIKSDAAITLTNNDGSLEFRATPDVRGAKIFWSRGQQEIYSSGVIALSLTCD